MLLNLLLVSSSLFSFDEKYINKQCKEKMLVSVSFSNRLHDKEIIHSLDLLSMHLYSHHVSDYNQIKSSEEIREEPDANFKLKSEHQFYFMDFSLKQTIITNIWNAYSKSIKEKMHNAPFIKKYLEEENEKLLYWKTNIIKSQIKIIKIQDENRIPYLGSHKKNYCNFLLWALLKQSGFNHNLKNVYIKNTQKYLNALPEIFHDIPSVNNYLQFQKLINGE